MSFENFKEIIREKLDDYRYNHSVCVANEAERLAKLYNADVNKAYLAGLLHDITKNYSSLEHLKIFEKFDIILTNSEKKAEKLWHAISGAIYVQKELNIQDSDIIGAIRYHTTAKAGMSKLEKIVYLADFTSADRTYPDVSVMRSLVDVSLEKAMQYSLNYTINSLKDKCLAPHPDTVAAYNEICQILSVKEI